MSTMSVEEVTPTVIEDKVEELTVTGATDEVQPVNDEPVSVDVEVETSEVSVEESPPKDTETENVLSESTTVEASDEAQPVSEEPTDVEIQIETSAMSAEEPASSEIVNGGEMMIPAASDEVQPVSDEPPSVDTQVETTAVMSDDHKPTVELFVKAAPVDKEDKGPCPISQQWFMAFYILVEKSLINLRVTPINLDQPPLPANYTSLEVGRRLPVAWVESGVSPQTGEDISGIVADTNDAIENLIDLWQCPNLAQSKNNPAQREAERAGEDLYKHFNLMLKDGSSKPLATDLRKVDDYLGQNPHRYMLSDELCYADCMLMPKLQHIRVAGKVYKDFEIDFSLKNLWLYIESMYATQAFYLSCPADCDILFHYMDKAKYPEGRKRPTLMSIEEKLNTVPDEVNSHRYEPINPRGKDGADNGEN